MKKVKAVKPVIKPFKGWLVHHQESGNERIFLNRKAAKDTMLHHEYCCGPGKIIPVLITPIRKGKSSK